MLHADDLDPEGARFEEIVETVAMAAQVSIKAAADQVLHFATGMGYTGLDGRAAAPDVAFLTHASIRTLEYRAESARRPFWHRTVASDERWTVSVRSTVAAEETSDARHP